MEHQSAIITGNRRYRAGAQDDVLASPLDDIMLFYHRPSGQTHMVISPVPEILEALGEMAEASAAEVHARLSSRYDLGEHSQALSAIEAHLEGLVALGLVRRG